MARPGSLGPARPSGPRARPRPARRRLRYPGRPRAASPVKPRPRPVRTRTPSGAVASRRHHASLHRAAAPRGAVARNASSGRAPAVRPRRHPGSRRARAVPERGRHCLSPGHGGRAARAAVRHPSVRRRQASRGRPNADPASLAHQRPVGRRRRAAGRGSAPSRRFVRRDHRARSSVRRRSPREPPAAQGPRTRRSRPRPGSHCGPRRSPVPQRPLHPHPLHG